MLSPTLLTQPPLCRRRLCPFPPPLPHTVPIAEQSPLELIHLRPTFIPAILAPFSHFLPVHELEPAASILRLDAILLQLVVPFRLYRGIYPTATR